jgi:hypothetical protein
MSNLLPFFLREATAVIKTYPRRVVFELPKIDVIASKLKVMEINGTIYVVGHLEGKVGCALAENEDGVIHVADVEGPVARDGATSNNATGSST